MTIVTSHCVFYYDDPILIMLLRLTMMLRFMMSLMMMDLEIMTVVNDDIFVDRNGLDDDNDDIVDDAHSMTIIRQIGQM